jgi:hypothetical protein
MSVRRAGGRPDQEDARRRDFDDLAARFDEHFSRVLADADWWPSARSKTGQALARVRELGAASRAVTDDAWLSAAYGALRRWQAFRGVRGGVPEARFRSVVAGLGDIVAPVESWTISNISGDGIARLYELFVAVAPIKPTMAKWVVTSKTLYHLLPELVTPMDGMVTAHFLRRSSLPLGLDRAFFLRFFGDVADVARSIGGIHLETLSRADPFASGDRVRIGQARVLDFAMAGAVAARGRTEDRRLASGS